MKSVSDIFRIDEFDGAAWLMLLLPAVVVAQQLAWELTALRPIRLGQDTLLLAGGVLAYLQIRRRPTLQLLGRIVLYGLCSLVIARFARELPSILNQPPREWDFYAFFLDAKVAAAGLNLYDPSNYAQVADQLALDVNDTFRREIIDVGFKYPPPTAMMLLPLSLGDAAGANRALMITVCAMMALACVLLSRILVSQPAPQQVRPAAVDAAAMAIVIMLTIPLDGLGLRHGQTTGLFACLATLVLLSKGSPAGGVAACLSVLVKPFAVIPSLVLLLGRKWAAVAAGTVCGVAIIAISLFVLGTDDWASYVGLEFANASPASLYSESGNHSLLATITRGFGYTDVPWGNSAIVLTYVVLAIAFAVPSIWMVTRIARREFGIAYCLLLSMALIIYPGTIYTYTIILSVPLAVLLWSYDRSGERYIVALIAIAAINLALQLNLNLFLANLIVWVALFMCALAHDRKHVAGMDSLERPAKPAAQIE